MLDTPLNSSNQAVEVSDLAFAYGEQLALKLEGFALARGTDCAVIGASGCGKSTFVHLLAGLLTPTEGVVRILGQNLSDMTEAERDRFRGRHIGFVFQRFHLMPALTVRQNLALAQRLSRSAESASRVAELLERLGLATLSERKPSELSHGQAQRVAIARALVHRPELVIADEPTSALDDSHAADALTLLTEVASESGAALLVVTHDHRVRGHLSQEFTLEKAP